MKNLIVASAFAISSLLAFAGPSQAQSASITITTHEAGPRHYRHWHRPRHYVRDIHRPRHGCLVKKVRSYRHGELLTRTTRICR